MALSVFRRLDGVPNTAKAGEEPLIKRIKRFAGDFSLDLALNHGRIEAEEVLHGSKVGGLHILCENPLSRSGFVRNRKSFLGRILLHLSVVPTEIPHPH